MSQTVGVAIICRNSEDTIDNCIESFINEVDQCVVVMAGKSEDKTAEILDSLKKVYPEKLEIYDFDWIDDFSAARNFSFSKLKTDWYLWVDSDDVVYQPQNLKVLAEKAPENVGFYWFPYHYSTDEFGNLTNNYIRERLLRAKVGWIWTKRLHETVAPVNEVTYLVTEDVIIRHMPSKEHPTTTRKSRNFRILNLMLKEDPADKRVWLYLGHQNFAAQYWMEAAKWYLKFGQDEGALPLERYQAYCYCAKALKEIKDKQAINAALAAIALFPQFKDAYLEMAHSYLIFGDIEKAIHYAKMSDVKDPLITEPPAVIFINQMEYTFNKYALFAECHMKLGDYKTAHEYMAKCKELRPTPEIENNLVYLDNLARRERVKDGLRCLATELLNTQEIIKLPSLLAACPYWYRDTDEFDQLKTGVAYYTKDIADKPETSEGKDKSIVVNIANAVNPEKLLADLDLKYDDITVIAPLPSPEAKLLNVYCQKDMEAILISSPNRRVVNLRNEPSRIICEYDHKPTDPQGLSIRFFVGQGLEYWSPQTIKEMGCGGSETSAAWLAKNLAAKGCQPIIYAMDNQVWDGVIYRLYSRFNPSAESHLFISSRIPDVFDNQIPAVQKWLWMHDICCWDRLTVDRAEKINCIIVLSHWHADHIKRVYPFLKNAEVIDMDDQDKTYEDTWTTGVYYPDDLCSRLPKIAIIGDAIETSRFTNLNEERIPYRFIWASSPDRGLEELLNMWPLLKKEMPEATLKIFYGWEYFNSSLGIPAQREFKERIRQLIDQDGVQWCGRIGQDQLAHELAQADALIYPPPHQFRETYGIAFLEAQAAGVICFYRQNGALGETIGKRGIPLKMDATPEQIVSIVKTTLADKTLCGKIRAEAINYGMKRDWGGQADKVISLYRRLSGNKE